MAIDGSTGVQVLRIKEVMQKVGRSRSGVYSMVQEKKFPPPFKLGGSRASGWIKSEVDEWLVEQIKKCRSTDSEPHL